MKKNKNKTEKLVLLTITFFWVFFSQSSFVFAKCAGTCKLSCSGGESQAGYCSPSAGDGGGTSGQFCCVTADTSGADPNPIASPNGSVTTNPNVPGSGVTSGSTPVTATTGTGGPYQNQEKIPGAPQQRSEFIPYIQDIINFGFAILGILALFMLIIGAYQYLMAAGNIGKVDSAKETIGSALLGLILGLCAWIILYKINPDLVNFRGITTISGTSSTNTGVNNTNTNQSPGTPSNLSNVQCDTVRNYNGFMNNNLSSLYNENVKSAQDLQNALTSFRKNNNGLTPYSDTIYQACKDNNVPYWYMIGTFAKESSMFSEGTKGCSGYNNPGCMMSGGTYTRYNTPEEGIRANIENMGRRLKENPTPLGAWNAWYWPDRSPENCAGAQEYLDMFSQAAKATGLSDV